MGSRAIYAVICILCIGLNFDFSVQMTFLIQLIIFIVIYKSPYLHKLIELRKSRQITFEFPKTHTHINLITRNLKAVRSYFIVSFCVNKPNFPSKKNVQNGFFFSRDANLKFNWAYVY